jgi:hypothetical protein
MNPHQDASHASKRNKNGRNQLHIYQIVLRKMDTSSSDQSAPDTSFSPPYFATVLLEITRFFFIHTTIRGSK